MKSKSSVRRLQSTSLREQGIGPLRRYGCLGCATDGYGVWVGGMGDEAAKCSQSTGKLLFYPLVEDRRAEAPDLADLQGTNHATPRHLLERLGMDSHDRRRLV